MFKESILIRRPVLEVFDYILDAEKSWQWAPYFLSVRPSEGYLDRESATSDADASSSDSTRRRSRGFNVRIGLSDLVFYETELFISDWRRGRYIIWRNIDPPQVARYNFEPVSAGTYITAEHNPWTWPGMDFARQLVVQYIQEYLSQGLNNLKNMLEERPPASRYVAFLSYRRKAADYVVGRLIERLTNEFGLNAVFRDISSITAGGDWRRAIDDAIENSSVMIALIGPDWLAAFENPGPEGDWVRHELASALHPKDPKKKKAVIPVTLEGVDPGKLFKPNSLPEDLDKLQDRQWQPLRTDPDYAGDVQRVVDAIWKEVELEDPQSEGSVIQPRETDAESLNDLYRIAVESMMSVSRELMTSWAEMASYWSRLRW
jgi:hypothetical protein